MARYSAHEHTAKIRNRPDRESDLERGILARGRLLVYSGDTRDFNWHTRERGGAHRFPAGKRLDIRIIQLPFDGGVVVQAGGWRDLTLIELPDTNRLRILWRSGWHVELCLDSFRKLLELAGCNYGGALPALTTVNVSREAV